MTHRVHTCLHRYGFGVESLVSDFLFCPWMQLEITRQRFHREEQQPKQQPPAQCILMWKFTLKLYWRPTAPRGKNFIMMEESAQLPALVIVQDISLVPCV